MPTQKQNAPNTQLHPLEESVLSLATGKVDQPAEQTAENLLVIPGTTKPAQERQAGTATVTQQRIRSIAESFQECMLFVGNKVLGRQEVIKQSFLAVLTGEHQLLISRTGMAKSLLARQIFACFDGAQIFEKQLTKDTMP